jgi:resuscitation-promoting factor RpfA
MGSELAGWWRPWSLPAVPVGVGLLELALVRVAGPPARQVEVLRQLTGGGTDPVAPLLALLALGAQGLAAYLLLVLGLRLLALLPGVLGRLAAGAALRLTPVAVRRALDLLLGGALLAQVTLASLPARAAAAPPPLATMATTTAPAGRSPAPLPPWLTPRPQPRSTGPAHAPETTPVPTPASSGAVPTAQPAVPGAAPARAPGGSGATSATGPGAAGGRTAAGPAGRPPATAADPAGPEAPSRAERGAAGAGAEAAGAPQAPGAEPVPRHGRDRPERAEALDGTPANGGYTIRAGDTLWGIAAAHLPPARRSAAAIDRYWRQVYRANRAVLGPDPDLIHPGTRLRLPPDQPGRR